MYILKQNITWHLRLTINSIITHFLALKHCYLVRIIYIKHCIVKYLHYSAVAHGSDLRCHGLLASAGSRGVEQIAAVGSGITCAATACSRRLEAEAWNK